MEEFKGLSLYGESGLKLYKNRCLSSFDPCLSLYGESGLKSSIYESTLTQCYRLSLYGESGLKLFMMLVIACALVSLSLWREWIEILHKSFCS